jgi:hypothetical protein
MIPLPFLVACGVLVSFMISINAFHKWRNIELGGGEIMESMLKEILTYVYFQRESKIAHICKNFQKLK